jgi:hypothetical protein
MQDPISGIVFVYVAIAIPDTLNVYNPHGLVAIEICPYNLNIFPASFFGIYRVVASTIVYIIPFLAILVFNISIIVTLAQRIRKDNISSHQAQTSKTDGHITVLLFLVTMVFFVTSIPWTLDKWIWFYIMPVINTVRMAWIRKLAYELTIFVLFINPSVNFYIYCLGCQKFRMDVKHVLLNRIKGSRFRHRPILGGSLSQR